MNQPMFSCVIPPNSSFTISGTTDSGAGERFDVFVPAHRRVIDTALMAPSNTITFTGGGPPYGINKPMTPANFKDTTLDLLPITIAFYWWDGAHNKFVMASDFTQKSATDSEVIVGFNDDLAGGSGYTNQIVTITWQPAHVPLALLSDEKTKYDNGKSQLDVLVRLGALEDRMRVVEAMAATAFSHIHGSKEQKR